jgi:hypothetical protein
MASGQIPTKGRTNLATAGSIGEQMTGRRVAGSSAAVAIDSPTERVSQTMVTESAAAAAEKATAEKNGEAKAAAKKQSADDTETAQKTTATIP